MDPGGNFSVKKCEKKQNPIKYLAFRHLLRVSVLPASRHFFIAILQNHTFFFKVRIFSQNPVFL